MDSGRFFRNRLGQLIPVLVGINVIAFLMLRLIPGDPAVIMLGTHATPKQVISYEPNSAWIAPSGRVPGIRARRSAR